LHHGDDTTKVIKNTAKADLGRGKKFGSAADQLLAGGKKGHQIFAERYRDRTKELAQFSIGERGKVRGKRSKLA